MRTPTSPAGGKPDHPSAGFTLIEVVAVLVVWALVASTLLISISRRPDRLSLSALAADTAGVARAARNQAIRNSQESTVTIDLGKRTVEASGGGPRMAIPQEVDIEVFSSSSERGGEAVAGIRFFADGASTGGTIRLGSSGGTYEIRVNWFTGRVRVIPPS